ncbi:MAG: PilZ domain-containing protein [Candidatus Methylomirabilota bacterium]
MITQSVTPGYDARGRRRFIRLPVSLPVIGWVLDRSGLEIRGVTFRVGAGGLEVEFPQEIPPGSPLRVVLRTQRGPIELDCRVVFAIPTGTTVRHGLAFLEPKDPHFAMELFLRESR